MDSSNKSEGNVDPFSNSPSIKIPNFFPKEINHCTPINHCGTSPSLKGAPSPIYEYFDASQKFLMNNERTCHKNIHSRFGGKSSEESTPNNEISINQQTPNYESNFFNITSLSPVKNQNNFVNQEINEYLKTKKHLLTFNYNSDINQNDIKEVNESLQENQNNIEDNNSITNNMTENTIQFNDCNIDLTNEMFDNYNNILTNNEMTFNQMPNHRNNYQTQKAQLIKQNINIHNKLNKQYSPNDNVQIKSNLSLNNYLNNQFTSQTKFVNPKQCINNNNNNNNNNMASSTIFYSQPTFPNNQIQTNNNYQQDLQNKQQIQPIQLNNNINNNTNQNIFINIDNFQNISVSNLNPECYIFERFGKKGWQCEKCKNFNFEYSLVRVICNKCKNNMIPKIINKEALFTEPKEKRKKPLIERKGDWLCPKCKNLNFTFRLSCNRCNLTKTEAEIINYQWNSNTNNNNNMNYSKQMNDVPNNIQVRRDVNYGNVPSLSNYFN